MKEINIAGLAVILIFILFIANKKDKLLTDYLLIGINGWICVYLITDLYVRTLGSSLVFIINDSFQFYLFPLYFSYTANLTKPRQAIERKELLAFAWAGLYTLFVISDHYLLHSYTPEELTAIYEHLPWPYHVFYIGNVIIIVVFLLSQRKNLNRYQQSLKQNFSETSRLNISWIKTNNLIYLFLAVTSFVAYYTYQLNIVTDIRYPLVFILFAMVACLFYLSYRGIHHYALAQLNLGANNLVTATSEAFTEKYSSSSLTTQDVENIHQQLLAYIEGEQPYLNPELSIQEVALALDVSVHAVSQTINSQEQKTFYDFVNGYRVDHLKKLLADPQNARYTILGLAHDSGFNSKASLNRVFKNHTQQTPSEYRKAQTGV